jgi:hypothetical protein
LDAAFESVSHDRHRVVRRTWTPISAKLTLPTRSWRRLKRVAVIAGITLVISIVFAVGIYVGAFVILSPMMG